MKGVYFMKRFKNILFVYDGEKESGVALKKAISLAQENKATLTIVEVLEELPPEIQRTVQSSKIVDFQKTVEEDSRRDLKDIIETIEKTGIQVKSRVLWGKPFIEIIRQVLENNHDLVMISPQKKPKLKEMLFGSRTMHLLRKCPCPVWVIIPSQPKKYARILAAVDAAPLDEKSASLNIRIMELATSLAHMEKSEIHIVHCWEPYFNKTVRSRTLITGEETDKLVREARNTNKRRINELVGKFDLEGLTHKVHILECSGRANSKHGIEKENRTGCNGHSFQNGGGRIFHRQYRRENSQQA